MTTIEMEVKKAALARDILNETDEKVVDKLLDSFREARKFLSSPCQFTGDELRAEIRKSEQAIREGRVVTQEYMREKHPRR
jgi:hypothetical protein